MYDVSLQIRHTKPTQYVLLIMCALIYCDESFNMHSKKEIS